LATGFVLGDRKWIRRAGEEGREEDQKKTKKEEQKRIQKRRI
jgi:hypothetical protein